MKARTLIIEDQDGVGRAIEYQLGQLGSHHFTVDHARSIAHAIDRVNAARREAYDLILCDYHMGEGTNGQQLLEYLRFERKIPRRTVFVMLTAEASYAAVASSVELAPDAYLLKPFTVDALARRVEFGLVKRQALAAAHTALDQEQPDWQAAISACNALILEHNRFAVDALRLRAECLIRLENFGEAASTYDKIIAWRPMPWASVGLARSLRLSGELDLAEEKLQAVIQDFPTFVGAFDEMAAVAREKGDAGRAQSILEIAHGVVPSNRRTRELGVLALANNDLENASRYLRIVTEKDRHGLMRSTEDFFGLARALRQLNQFDEALSVLDNLKDHFPETRPLTVRKLAAEALALQGARRQFDAKKKVREAEEMREHRMEPRTQLELAHAAHACGEAETAQRIFIHVAENWHEDAAVVHQVMATLNEAGMGEDGLRMVKDSMKQLVVLNNRAAGCMKAGQWQEAVQIMEQVAGRLTHNATIQANYIQSLLAWVENNASPKVMDLPEHSKPRRYIATAREHLKQLARIDPKHPRLPPLQRMFAALTGELRAGADAEPLPQEAASMEIGE